MTNLEIYPLIDDFETTLAQEWDGSTGTIYLNAVPSFTFPSGVTTVITVNPSKSVMQAAIIDSIDTANKTANVSSITINKGASVAYTQQTHGVGSVVRISDNYAFWEALVTSLNSKVDGDTQPFPSYADATARDAAITTPLEGMVIKNTATGVLQAYLGGAWTDLDTGTVTPNASETVAGKKEDPTDAEVIAGTDVGGTGATMSPTPSQVAKVAQSNAYRYAGASAVGTDAYAVTMTPTLTVYTTGMRVSFLADVVNTGACTIDIDSLGVKSIKTLDGNDPQDGAVRVGINELVYDGTNFVLQNEDIASTSNKGIASIASTTTAYARTSTTEIVTPEQLGQSATSKVLSITRAMNAASGTTTTAHGLTKIPKLCSAIGVVANETNASSNGFSDGTNNSCVYFGEEGNGGNVTEEVGNSDTYAIILKVSAGTSSGQNTTQSGIITFDATNVTITRTKTVSGTESTENASIKLLVQ